MSNSPPVAPSSPPLQPQPPTHPAEDSQEPDPPNPNPQNPSQIQQPSTSETLNSVDESKGELTQLRPEDQQQSDVLDPEPEPEPDNLDSEGMDITRSPINLASHETKSFKGNSSVRRTTKRKKGVKTRLGQAALEKKMQQLSQNLKPIPFNPCKSLDFTKHEALLKKLGLWDFAHVEFDRNIRVDLVKNLIVEYNVSKRGSYVYGSRIGVSRADLARALKLPLSKKVDCDIESYPKEFLLFLEEFVYKWMLLHEDPWVTPAEIMKVMKLIQEGNPHKVDWAGMIWGMMEKELAQKATLKECYYASFFQHLVKVQKEELLSEIQSLDIEAGTPKAGVESNKETVAVDDDNEDEDDGGDVKMVDVEELGSLGKKVEEEEEQEQDIELKLGQDIVREMENVGDMDKVDKDEDFHADDDGEKVDGSEKEMLEDIDGEKEEQDIGEFENVNAGEEEHDIGKFGEVCKEVEEHDIGKFGEVRKEEEEHDIGKFGEIRKEEEEHDIGKFGEVSKEEGEHDDIKEFEDVSKEEKEHDIEKCENVIKDEQVHDIGKVEDICEENNEHDIGNSESVEEGKKMEGIETANLVENIDNIENMEEENNDEETMDYGVYKEEQLGQRQWTFDGNIEGKPFLQRCSMTEVNASRRFEDVSEDIEDDEEEEHVQGFKIMPKAPVDGMTSSNLMQAFEAGQLPFPSNELGVQSSLELMTSRTDNNMMLGGPSSIFNQSVKREIDHDIDMDHQGFNDSHKRMRVDGNWDNKAPEFDLCIEQVHQWLEKAKTAHTAATQEVYQQASMTQFYVERLQEKENEIAQLKNIYEASNRGKQLELDRLNRELNLMNRVIDGYRKALKQTQMKFADFRKQCQVRDEPIYKDAGPGGVVKSVMELERERLKQEEENKRNRIYMVGMLSNFANDFEVKCDDSSNKILAKLQYQHSRLIDATKEVELLKNYHIKHKKPANGGNGLEAPSE